MLEVLKASKSFPNQKLPAYVKDIEGKVAISIIPKKGRGLISCQHFNPGDLIIGHRALEIIFPDSQSQSSSLLNKVKRFRQLKESLTELASKDEEFRRKLYFLHAGLKLGFVEKKELFVGSESKPAEELMKGKVSLKRIEGIILVNGFQGPSTGEEGMGGPFGIWYLPSFINHDCFKANANWSIFNDFMFVRASKTIDVGDEILISYIDPDQPYFVRQELFLKHDFICSCKLCSIEKQEGEFVKEQRNKVLISFKNHVNAISSLNAKPNLLLLSSVFEELKSLRPSPMENPFVLQPLMQMGLCLFEGGDFDKAIPIFKDAIQVCQSFPQFSSVGTTLSIAVLKCYLNKENEHEKIQVWISRLKQWIKLQYGCMEDDVQWHQILEVTMPAFALEIEQYVK